MGLLDKVGKRVQIAEDGFGVKATFSQRTVSYNQLIAELFSCRILIVPLLVKKILRVSDLATQCSVSILWKLWRKNGEDHVLLEALQVGAFEKLLVVLQVGCEEKTKERASELLRNLNRCRNEIEKTNCLDSSMRLKNVKKSF